MRTWLKSIRKSKGLTLKQLGEMTGYTESTICSIENGDRQKKMDLSLAVKLAEIFEITLDDIARLENEREAV